MLSEIDWLSKQELIEKINELDLFMERIREELYENNCESDRVFLNKLKEEYKLLIEQKDRCLNNIIKQ